MKIIKHLMIVLLVMFSVTLVLGLTAFAEEKKQEVSEEDKKMMEMMEKYATPGENHKHLDYFVGEWESLVKVIGGPGSEAMNHRQDITVKWILGGRYLRAHLKGTFLGRTYDSIVFTGYDNYNDEVFAIQFSNMDTGYFITTGTLSKDGKVRTETGIMNDAPGKKTKVKAVTTLLDRNKYKYEFYTLDAKGKETKTMEINYTRK